MQTYGIGARPSHVWGTWPPPRGGDQSGAAQRTTVRAIVVDDHARARRDARWELRFETDLDVVGEARTGVHGVALAQELHPDIVIMNADMAYLDGMQAAERVHALAPDCILVLLTARDSIETHERALAAGASVILEKGNPAVFRASMHDLVQFVKARNMPAWPEIDTPPAPIDDEAAVGGTMAEEPAVEGPTAEGPVDAGSEQT